MDPMLSRDGRRCFVRPGERRRIRSSYVSDRSCGEPPPLPDNHRRRTTAEANAEGGPAADLPGVPITADEITKTLRIGGTAEIIGDLILRGKLYMSDVTEVRSLR